MANSSQWDWCRCWPENLCLTTTCVQRFPMCCSMANRTIFVMNTEMKNLCPGNNTMSQRIATGKLQRIWTRNKALGHRAPSTDFAVDSNSPSYSSYCYFKWNRLLFNGFSTHSSQLQSQSNGIAFRLKPNQLTIPVGIECDIPHIRPLLLNNKVKKTKRENNDQTIAWSC